MSEVKIVQMKLKLKTKLKLKFALSSLRFAAFKATTLCQLGQKARKESSCHRERERGGDSEGGGSKRQQIGAISVARHFLLQLIWLSENINALSARPNVVDNTPS